MARLVRRVFGRTSAPSAPTIVAVEATSSTSISVHWAASKKDGGSPITGYIVEYYNTSNPASGVTKLSVGSDVCSMTLDDLASYTEYAVWVRGVNSVGRSVSSGTKRIKTKADGSPFLQLQLEGDQLEVGSDGDLKEEDFAKQKEEVKIDLEELMKKLKESVEKNEVDSFHSHLFELENTLQNFDRMKELLQEGGVLCYAAYIGSNPVAATLIQKEVDINAISVVPEYSDVEMTPLHWAAYSGHTDTVQFLIDKGADIDIREKDERTALHLAAAQGHIDTVRCLVEKGAEINIKGKDGMTPLHWAAGERHIDIVQYLIDKGANINIKENDGLTPLHQAAVQGHTDTVRCLIDKGADMNIKEKDGMTPLHWAAGQGHVDTVQYLIDKGADINIKDVDELTPLHQAAVQGHTDTVQCLIDKGANINIKEKDGETPLHLAAKQGHNDTVRCLVKKGADVNIKHIGGVTLLHQAVKQSHVDEVAFLLENGADVSIKDGNDMTPLHWAAKQGHVAIVRCLVKKKVDVNIKDKSEETPLHLAAKQGHIDTVRCLIEKGADVNIKHIGGMTLLHQAVEQGDVDTVKYLVEYGADVNAKDGDDMTPLHWAAKQGHMTIVQCLVEKGAEINIEDGKEMTPLVLAAYRHQMNIVKYLQDMLLVNESSPRQQEGRQSQGKNAEFRRALIDQLKPYTRKAKPTGTELGSGTYGTVIELRSSGETVAGKVFKTMSCTQPQMMIDKLCAELRLMTQLHHEKIVQCKGVCFLESQIMPVLLMERLMTSLHAYLLDPTNFNMTLLRKLAILHDVASGLVYLHSHTPAIIHRDLTGKNVLLNSELTAKIADFGNARIMDLDAEATPETFTSLPGTLEYMPPEAQGGSPKYDPSLDVFSFGHLLLFTIIQAPVHPLLPSTYTDAEGLLHARSEVKRREVYLGKAEQLLQEEHPLVVLVKQCLHNYTARRPQTAKLATTLQDILSTMGAFNVFTSSPSQSTTSIAEQLGMQVTPVSSSGLSHVTVSTADQLRRVTPGTSTQLHLREIQNQLRDVTKWHQLGVQLGVPAHELSIIENNHSRDAERCKTETLLWWLRNVDDISWEKLAQAVEELGHRVLAQKLRKEGSV